MDGFSVFNDIETNLLKLKRALFQQLFNIKLNS
jgi:hypothetical protein